MSCWTDGSRRAIAIVIVIASALTGCSAPVRPASATPAHLADDLAQRYPATRERLATTDSRIYLANLNARLDGLRSDLQRDPKPEAHSALANGLLQRFRLEGRIEDAELALAETEIASAAATAPADAWLMRASALSVFHRFEEARSALERAQSLGAADGLVARVRRDLDVAQGRYDLLREELASSAQPVPDFYELAHRADLRVLVGDLAGASQHYRAAQELFTDTSPAQLSWLYVQQGIALLRFGQFAEARRFFANAHERFPTYVLASEHLAECDFRLGDYDAARELYRQVIAQTANPEYQAALARVEQAAGRPKEAERLIRAADAGYRSLLARHRAGYAQHLAEFLLDQRHAAPEALALARENLAIRADVGSLILLARSAEAAGQVDEACAAQRRVEQTHLNPPEAGLLAALVERCDAASSATVAAGSR